MQNLLLESGLKRVRGNPQIYPSFGCIDSIDLADPVAAGARSVKQ
jgi:hypothetical protein